MAAFALTFFSSSPDDFVFRTACSAAISLKSTSINTLSSRHFSTGLIPSYLAPRLSAVLPHEKLRHSTTTNRADKHILFIITPPILSIRIPFRITIYQRHISICSYRYLPRNRNLSENIISKSLTSPFWKKN